MVAVIKVKAGPREEVYRVYIKEDVIVLYFHSTDADEAHLKAHVLKLIDVEAEQKKYNDRDEWHIYTYTNALVSKDALQEFREALAKAVEEVAQKGLIKAETATRWAETLRKGVTLEEDKLR